MAWRDQYSVDLVPGLSTHAEWVMLEGAEWGRQEAQGACIRV